MASSGNPYPRNDKHAQAAYWFVQLRKSDCAATTRKTFDVWLEENSANAAAYEHVERAWRASAALEASASLEELRRNALIATVERPGKRSRRLVWSGAAAAAASLLVAALVFAPSLHPPSSADDPERLIMQAALEGPASSIARGAPLRTLSTSIGERSAMPLHDGSFVELSTETSVRVAFTEERREIVLLHGQAVFDVFHDPDRPFVVLAGDRRITALGTEFEVRLADGDVAVTMLEGRVEIAEVRAADTAERDAEPLAVVSLEAGQRLSARVGVAEEVAPDVLDRAMAWREGWLRFENDTLSDVIAEINRYSYRKFELANDELGALRVSGHFRAGSVESFSSTIIEVYPVAISADANRSDVLLIDWRV